MTAHELSDYEQSQVDRFGIFAEEEANTRRLAWFTDEELRVELDHRADETDGPREIWLLRS